MLEEIRKKIKDKKSSSFYNILNKNYSTFIINQTEFLNKNNPTFNERLYCLLNNISEIKICKSCEKKVKFINYTEGYRQYCSSTCSKSSEETLEKRQETMLLKYGTLAPNRDKMKKTIKEKCGVDNANQSEEIKNKKKKTFLTKYGVENISQLESNKEKVANTMLEKYGETSNLKVDYVKEQIKETNLRKYGKEFPTQSKKVKEKTKKQI